MRRPALAYARNALAPIVLVPTVALPGALQYALAPELAPLLPLFNGQQLAVMLNVGTLVQPTTKAQYQVSPRGPAALDAVRRGAGRALLRHRPGDRQQRAR